MVHKIEWHNNSPSIHMREISIRAFCYKFQYHRRQTIFYFRSVGDGVKQFQNGLLITFKISFLFLITIKLWNIKRHNVFYLLHSLLWIWQFGKFKCINQFLTTCFKIQPQYTLTLPASFYQYKPLTAINLFSCPVLFYRKFQNSLRFAWHYNNKSAIRCRGRNCKRVIFVY